MLIRLDWNVGEDWADLMPLSAFAHDGTRQFQHDVVHPKRRKPLAASCILSVRGEQAILDYRAPEVVAQNNLSGVYVGVLHLSFAGPSRTELVEARWQSADRASQDGVASISLLPDIAPTTDLNNTSSLFKVGNHYTRQKIATLVKRPYAKGGNWDTGYDAWKGEHFIFCNVGSSGRTGHDYPNRWKDACLIWYGKTNSTRKSPAIRRMIGGEESVHIFWRSHERTGFTYAGLGHALEADDMSPVRVVWSFESVGPSKLTVPNARFRRGPPPLSGDVVRTFEPGPAYVYLMVLKRGELLFQDCGPDHSICKFGMSSAPLRRVKELNCGFPFGSEVRWEIHSMRYFNDSMTAFHFETKCLEAMREDGTWMGGEFGRLHKDKIASAFN